MLWIISLPLVLFSLLVLTFNFFIFVRTQILKKHAPSVVPLLGSVICSLGLYLMPVDVDWYYLVLPHLIDYGGVIWYLTLGILWELLSKNQRD